MIKRFCFLAFIFVFVATPAAVHAESPPSVVFVVDVSGSMKGEKIKAAQDAISSLVNNLPPQISVGLVTFSSTAQLAISPTTDRSVIKSGVAALKPLGRTAFYDSIQVARDAAPTNVKTFIIVLTDGDDTASKSSVSELSSRDWTNVQVSVIGVDFSSFSEMKKRVAGFISSTGGLLISVEDVRLLSKALSDSLLDSGITLPQRPTPQLQAANRPISINTSILVFLLSLLAGTSTVMIIWTFIRARIEKQAQENRRQVFTQYEGAPSDSQGRDRSTSPLDRPNEKLQAALEVAGVEWTLRRLRMMRLLLALVICFALLILRLPVILSVIVGLGIAFMLLGRYLNKRASARRSAFESELPDFLALTAGALRSGLPLINALEVAGKESDTELGKQMNRVIGEMSLGTSIERSLMRVAERMQSDPFASLASAIEIQRRVGGNLSEILDRTAQTVRARLELDHEVEALAAEGLLSAKVLTALPIGMFGFLLVTRREFVAPLWEKPAGWGVLALACVLILIGYQWISRLTKLEG